MTRINHPGWPKSAAALWELAVERAAAWRDAHSTGDRRKLQSARNRFWNVVAGWGDERITHTLLTAWPDAPDDVRAQAVYRRRNREG